MSANKKAKKKAERLSGAKEIWDGQWRSLEKSARIFKVQPEKILSKAAKSKIATKTIDGIPHYSAVDLDEISFKQWKKKKKAKKKAELLKKMEGGSHETSR